MKPTSPLKSILATALCGLLAATVARAADISGQWRAEFDSQVGQQKYLFTFKVNEGKVVGKATAELRDQKREVEFNEVKLDGATLTFVEMFKFQDNEVRYSVQADRGHRALAGLSMGGGQSLNFGLAHLDTFAWVGGFSSAPNTKAPEELLPNPAAAAQQLRLLWLGCGNKDGLIRISQGVHAYLKEKGVPHVWHVDGHAHDPTEWKNNLYLFVQRIFRENQ